MPSGTVPSGSTLIIRASGQVSLDVGMTGGIEDAKAVEARNAEKAAEKAADKTASTAAITKVVDKGTEQGLAAGARLAIYRGVSMWWLQGLHGKQPELPLASVGEAVVVTAAPTLSVVRITAGRGAVYSGLGAGAYGAGSPVNSTTRQAMAGAGSSHATGQGASALRRSANKG